MKFGFLLVSVTKVPAVATFATYREVAECSQLERTFGDFERGLRVFQAFSCKMKSTALKQQ